MFADIPIARGQYAQRRGKLESALADFETARTKDAAFFDAWMAEANVLFALHHPVEAMSAVRKALMLRPDSEAARALEASASSQISGSDESPAPRSLEAVP